VTDQPPPLPPSAEPPPSQAWHVPGSAPWGGGPPGSTWVPPQRTNGLAVTSLITALAQFVLPIPFALAITAIVTGHIGRRQIRERNEGGAGMALAGIIIGYVSIVLSVLGIAAIVLFLVFALPNIVQHEIRSDARSFGASAVELAAKEQMSPQSPDTIRRVYYEARDRNGCCSNDTITLADGTPVLNATEADFVRNHGRLEFSQSAISTEYACLQLPAGPLGEYTVRDGRC
jgi:uncharacterized membrane protein YjfL (UPF0719 family)